MYECSFVIARPSTINKLSRVSKHLVLADHRSHKAGSGSANMNHLILNLSNFRWNMCAGAVIDSLNKTLYSGRRKLWKMLSYGDGRFNICKTIMGIICKLLEYQLFNLHNILPKTLDGGSCEVS